MKRGCRGATSLSGPESGRNLLQRRGAVLDLGVGVLGVERGERGLLGTTAFEGLQQEPQIGRCVALGEDGRHDPQEGVRCDAHDVGALERLNGHGTS